MSRIVALCGLILTLVVFQMLFPWVLCAFVVGLGDLLLLALTVFVWGMIYTFPVALIALLTAALQRPKQWEAQLMISATTWAVALMLFAVVQIPAHMLMSWQLSDIRRDFEEKSGGFTYSCKAHWPAIDKRNTMLVRGGYTMYGWWAVSGDVWYDDSGKPDSCNVDTNAVYLFTWWPGKTPKRFDSYPW